MRNFVTGELPPSHLNVREDLDGDDSLGSILNGSQLHWKRAQEEGHETYTEFIYHLDFDNRRFKAHGQWHGYTDSDEEWDPTDDIYTLLDDTSFDRLRKENAIQPWWMKPTVTPLDARDIF